MTVLSQQTRLLPSLPLEGRAGVGVLAAPAQNPADPHPNPPLKGEGTHAAAAVIHP
ncbi:hypothetical protein GCM10007913_21110 [Devosia yakushimensis]|uniref:Uncharacterized protein n=1 Tax=Devosia yakushimensis TaxID=470028 RepID=A0ABQ5UGA2_9HYPH|nr:hypothetical protein GCM10007913_21110 [Devosia yakushimensis]